MFHPLSSSLPGLDTPSCPRNTTRPKASNRSNDRERLGGCGLLGKENKLQISAHSGGNVWSVPNTRATGTTDYKGKGLTIPRHPMLRPWSNTLPSTPPKKQHTTPKQTAPGQRYSKTRVRSYPPKVQRTSGRASALCPAVGQRPPHQEAGELSS